MSKDRKLNPDDGLSIGIVSRLTGINPETLRVWERRYNMTVPARAGMRKSRRYSQADVRRLSAVKALVDAGHPVSTVAHLPLEQLVTRLQDTGIPTHATAVPRTSPIRVIIEGESLALRLRTAAGQMPGIEIVGAFSGPMNLEERIGDLSADVVVLERASLQSNAIKDLHKRMASSSVRHLVVVYGFATRSTLNTLQEEGIVCVSQSAGIAEIQRACETAVAGGAVRALQAASSQFEGGIARRFSAGQLEQIAQSAWSVKCECPSHLVSLVNSLLSFETYTRECENLNEGDREIHRILYAATASSRAKLEAALAALIEFTGIKLS